LPHERQTPQASRPSCPRHAHPQKILRRQDTSLGRSGDQAAESILLRGSLIRAPKSIMTGLKFPHELINYLILGFKTPMCGAFGVPFKAAKPPSGLAVTAQKRTSLALLFVPHDHSGLNSYASVCGFQKYRPLGQPICSILAASYLAALAEKPLLVIKSETS
jgi:hypothetical protein